MLFYSSQKPVFLKSGQVISGLNKVFCGTENGVCELTKDTIYTHPTDKQCSWTSNVFTEITTYSSGSNIIFTSDTFSKGLGMYYLVWSFIFSSSPSSSINALTVTADDYTNSIHMIGGNDSTTTHKLTIWINVSWSNSLNYFSIIVDGTDVVSSRSGTTTYTKAILSTLYGGISTVSATLYYLDI